MKAKRVKVSISISESMRKRIEELADREGLTFSAAVASLIAAGFRRSRR